MLNLEFNYCRVMSITLQSLGQNNSATEACIVDCAEPENLLGTVANNLDAFVLILPLSLTTSY